MLCSEELKLRTMKTPNRKKIYAWKASWKRRKESERRHGGHKTSYYNATKSYCKPFWGKHRAKEREAIIKLLKGDTHIIFPGNHRQSATWEYW